MRHKDDCELEMILDYTVSEDEAKLLRALVTRDPGLTPRTHMEAHHLFRHTGKKSTHTYERIQINLKEKTQPKKIPKKQSKTKKPQPPQMLLISWFNKKKWRKIEFLCWKPYLQ